MEVRIDARANRDEGEPLVPVPSIHVVDTTRTARVLGELATEVGRAPLWDVEFRSIMTSIDDELQALRGVRSAIEPIGSATADRARSELDRSMSELDAFRSDAGAAPTSGWWALNAIPGLSKRHDVRSIAHRLQAARDAVTGARHALAETPEVEFVGTLLTHSLPAELEVPQVAAHTNSWVRRGPAAVQQVIRGIATHLTDRVFGVRTIGGEHVPHDGAVLLAPNHGSWLDIHSVYLRGHDRAVRTMALDSLKMPLYRFTGAFPLERGEGRSDAALALARGMLADGQAVAVYTEGRIATSEALGAPHSGIARLALETGAPVVPAAAYGTKPAFTRGQRWIDRVLHRPGRVIVYEPPLRFDGVPPTRDNVAAAREQIFAAMQRAYDRARSEYTAA